jgi:hypothetical protein
MGIDGPPYSRLLDHFTYLAIDEIDPQKAIKTVTSSMLESAEKQDSLPQALDDTTRLQGDPALKLSPCVNSQGFFWGPNLGLDPHTNPDNRQNRTPCNQAARNKVHHFRFPR